MTAEGKRYFGGFSDYASMVHEYMRGEYDYEARAYKPTVLPEGFPTDEQILFAVYGTEQSYQGDSTVVFETPSGLFIETSGHCSCNGLEGLWGPVATTRAALGMMWKNKPGEWGPGYVPGDYDAEAVEAFNVIFPKETP